MRRQYAPVKLPRTGSLSWMRLAIVPGVHCPNLGCRARKKLRADLYEVLQDESLTASMAWPSSIARYPSVCSRPGLLRPKERPRCGRRIPKVSRSSRNRAKLPARLARPSPNWHARMSSLAIPPKRKRPIRIFPRCGKTPPLTSRS
jgi:hypothetical protein